MSEKQEGNRNILLLKCVIHGAIIKQYVFLNTFGAILREGIPSRSISHNTHLCNNVLKFV